MIKHTGLILLLFLIHLKIYSQTPDTIKVRKTHLEKELGLLAGFNTGNSTFWEIGLSKVAFGSDGHHPLSYGSFFSTEIKLSNKFIIGPKVGAYFAGGSSAMGLGINLIYYTTFNSSSLVLRPEIGFSIHKLRILYGYNFKITNKDFAGISRSLFHTSYSFRLKSLDDKAKQ